jgi:hypothetical protein
MRAAGVIRQQTNQVLDETIASNFSNNNNCRTVDLAVEPQPLIRHSLFSLLA